MRSDRQCINEALTLNGFDCGLRCVFSSVLVSFVLVCLFSVFFCKNIYLDRVSSFFYFGHSIHLWIFYDSLFPFLSAALDR